MSAKRTTKNSVKQWHSWRPGWMSNTVILVAVLLGAVALLFATTSPKSLNVASVGGVNASTFTCSNRSASLKHDSGNIVASIAAKCGHDWDAVGLLETGAGNVASCGSASNDCVWYLPTSTTYYNADSYHDTSHSFNINITHPCNYSWTMQYWFEDKAGHKLQRSDGTPFYTKLPQC